MLGLTSIYIPDSVKEIDCSENNLTEVELPEAIEIVYLSCNNLTKLKARNELKCLICLDIRYNNMSDLDIRIPKTFRMFWMEGNPDLRIKYLEFLFPYEDNAIVLDGDFLDEYGNGLLQREYTRNKVGQRVYSGQKYIPIKEFY